MKSIRLIEDWLTLGRGNPRIELYRGNDNSVTGQLVWLGECFEASHHSSVMIVLNALGSQLREAMDQGAFHERS